MAARTWLEISLAVGKVLFTLWMLGVSVDSSVSAPSRVVAAIFLVGMAVDSRLHTSAEKTDLRTAKTSQRHDELMLQLTQLAVAQRELASRVARLAWTRNAQPAEDDE